MSKSGTFYEMVENTRKNSKNEKWFNFVHLQKYLKYDRYEHNQLRSHIISLFLASHYEINWNISPIDISAIGTLIASLKSFVVVPLCISIGLFAIKRLIYGHPWFLLTVDLLKLVSSRILFTQRYGKALFLFWGMVHFF